MVQNVYSSSEYSTSFVPTIDRIKYRSIATQPTKQWTPPFSGIIYEDYSDDYDDDISTQHKFTLAIKLKHTYTHTWNIHNSNPLPVHFQRLSGMYAPCS